METRANYIVVGAFTLAVATAAVLFGLFAAHFATEQAWHRYEVVFNESVIGLSRGSPVLYNGVEVGRVVDLRLNPDDLRQVIATVDIDAQVPIHADTVASVRLLGLTGSAAIQLRGGSPGVPLLKPDAHRPPRIQSTESPLTRLLESSEGILVTANHVVEQLSRLVSDENLARVESTLKSIESAAGHLAEAGPAASAAARNVMLASETLPELVSELHATAARLSGVLEGLDQQLLQALPGIREDFVAALRAVRSLATRLDAIVAANQPGLMEFNDRQLTELGSAIQEFRQVLRNVDRLLRALQTDAPGTLLRGEKIEEFQTP